MVSEESESVTESLGDLSALGSLAPMGNRIANPLPTPRILFTEI